MFHARSKYEPHETTWKVSWRAELEAVPRTNLQGLGAMPESLSAKTTTSRWEELTQKIFEKRCRNQSQALPTASTKGGIFSNTIVKTMPYLVKPMVFAIKNGCCTCHKSAHSFRLIGWNPDGMVVSLTPSKTTIIFAHANHESCRENQNQWCGEENGNSFNRQTHCLVTPCSRNLSNQEPGSSSLLVLQGLIGLNIMYPVQTAPGKNVELSAS